MPPMNAVCAPKLTSISRSDRKFFMRALSSCIAPPRFRTFNFGPYEYNTITKIYYVTMQDGATVRCAFSRTLQDRNKRPFWGSKPRHRNETNREAKCTLHSKHFSKETDTKRWQDKSPWLGIHDRCSSIHLADSGEGSNVHPPPDGFQNNKSIFSSA